MKARRPILRVVLLATPLLAAAFAAPAAAETRTIPMRGNDAMQFSVQRIEARPGESIRVELTTTSRMSKASMAHNFVLLAAGVDVDQFAMEAAMAAANDYLPAREPERILAATGLAGGGETVEVTFDAPLEPGEYIYICTFPGHYTGGMTGVLVVTED